MDKFILNDSYVFTRLQKCMIVHVYHCCRLVLISLKTTFYVGPEVKRLDFMNDVAAKIPVLWNTFGIQLKIPKGSLDYIQEIYGKHPSPVEQFGKTYDLWEQTKTKSVTWKTVIDILKEPSLSQISLSEELSKKYEW